MKATAILFLFTLFIVSCTGKNGTGSSGDGVGPSIFVESISDGLRTISDSGITSIDSLVLILNVKDPGGVEYVAAKSGNGRYSHATMVGSDTLWRACVYLVPGMNTITIKAEDEDDNESYITRKVFFNTNYLPIDNSSIWVFVWNGTDTFKIESDSMYRLGQAPYNILRVKYHNPKYHTSSNTAIPRHDTVYFAQSDADSTILFSRLDYTSIIGDTLFRKDYSSYTNVQKYRFIGDTTFVLSSGSHSYRNCIKVSVTDTANHIAGVSSYFMVPGKGFVALETQSRDLYLAIPQLAVHP